MRSLKNIILGGILVSFLLIMTKCFPTYQATQVKFDSFNSGDYSDLQAKLFKSDDTIILFPDGFKVKNNTVIGQGITIKGNKGEKVNDNIEVDFDSISAMITYEETTSGARYFGSFLFALTAPPLSFLGVYCLACPKCCFGSCPTVYTFDDKNYNLEAELFSECISRQLEDNDIDIIQKNITDNFYKLKITNEALETHYINKFNLVVAEHPLNTKLYLTNNDRLRIAYNEVSLLSAVNNYSEDITNLLLDDDEKYYRSGVDKVAKLKNGPSFDWIEITSPAVNDSITMIIKYRNTLLSTTLLYDVVIGSQGIRGLDWIKNMNKDPAYAKQFKLIYQAFSGIKIKTWDNNSWKELGKFKDAGPLNWKYLSAQIPTRNNKITKIRLEYIPDNFMIDYIAFDTTKSTNHDIKTKLYYPTKVVDGYGNERHTLLNYIKEDDSDYLKTDPGDNYLFTYNIPQKSDVEQSVLIYSKGYYNEWIRGGWISNNSNHTFDLYDIKGTLVYLADSWLENSKIIESEFFHSRFSLKEEK